MNKQQVLSYLLNLDRYILLQKIDQIIYVGMPDERYIGTSDVKLIITLRFHRIFELTNG